MIGGAPRSERTRAERTRAKRTRAERTRAGLPLGALLYFLIMLLLGLYFAFAAIQGPSGILRRVQLTADTAELSRLRDGLVSEVDSMRNLTRRLSDSYLDLDLLDERAREVLGLVRADELIIQ